MLRLTLNPSKTLVVLLTASHAASLLLLFWLPLYPGYLAVLIALLALSYLRALRKYALLLARDSINGLQFDESGLCRFQLRNGDWIEAPLKPSSSVFSWLVVLNFSLSSARKTRHAVVLPDSTDAESFRKLRVWLRWKQHKDVSDLT